ncbi:MAG: hypothetical protein RL662_696 [Bacteroidota bacterium]|jgi:uncharacterized lipoprotein YddW (UPF0748 family)
MKKLIYLLSLLYLVACSDKEVARLSEKKILEFKIEQDANAQVVIDEQAKTITAIVSKSVNLFSVTPLVTVSTNAALNPQSGALQDFTNDRKIRYTVYAEDGSTQIYTVAVSHQPSAAKELLSFSFPDYERQATIQDNQIKLSIPYGIDLSRIKTQGSLSAGATSVPRLDTITDFSKPLTYTLTAQDKTTQTYTVSLTVEPQQTGVRAVWIPDPTHTNAMRSYQHVLNTVKLLDELNINTIYVATWARNQTAFDSQVLLNNSTYANKGEGNFFAPYKATYNAPVVSPTGDPLKDLITEAHKKDIKVVFWFEYGFMASNGATTAQNSKVFDKHPDWMGKANDGSLSNYNKTDYYFNAYNPDVQEFLLSLIEESLTLYPEADGIQGDDRMPAMPRNSGYEDYTIDTYKAEHAGNLPPQDINNAAWVKWRLAILNQFGKTLHTRIKAKKSTALVCFSPNPYPWSEQNLMQQWTTWVESGIVDILSVQCYRYDLAAYNATAKQALGYVTANTTQNIFNPGMILKSGATIMTEKLLREQLDVNRELNTNGEAFFYIDGLYDANVQKVLRIYYAGKAKFPTN